jgi:hypothetical protein
LTYLLFHDRHSGLGFVQCCLSVIYTATTSDAPPLINRKFRKMSDLRNYSKQFMYREFPCLWRIKSKQYSNRNLRNEAYEKLLAKWKEIEPEANKDMVIKKINTLRTAFRREMKKVKEGTHSGMGSDDVYEPRLWYYPLLYFTIEQETCSRSKCHYSFWPG